MSKDYINSAKVNHFSSGRNSQLTSAKSKLRRQNRMDDIQYKDHNYKISSNLIRPTESPCAQNIVDNQYEMEVGDSDDIIAVPLSQMIFETHYSKSNGHSTPIASQDSHELEYDQIFEKLNPNMKNSYDNEYNEEGKDSQNFDEGLEDKNLVENHSSFEEKYDEEQNYDWNREQDGELEENYAGTGDLREKFVDEYQTNEGIAIPRTSFPK